MSVSSQHIKQLLPDVGEVTLAIEVEYAERETIESTLKMKQLVLEYINATNNIADLPIKDGLLASFAVAVGFARAMQFTRDEFLDIAKEAYMELQDFVDVYAGYDAEPQNIPS